MTQHLGPLGGNNGGSGRPAGFPGFHRRRSGTTAYAQKEDVARTPQSQHPRCFPARNIPFVGLENSWLLSTQNLHYV